MEATMPDPPKPHAPKGPLKLKRSRDLLRSARGTCTATSKTSGKPCRYPAIPGGTVCRFHGGNAPQVRQSAMARLMELQHPAINRLEQLIGQDQFPSVSYAASRDVLDRTMGKPQESVSLTGSEGGPLEIIIKKPWKDE